MDRILSESTLGELAKCNDSFRKFVHAYMAKQQWNKEDRRKILDKLADIMVTSGRKMIASLACVLGPLTLDLLHRYETQISAKEPAEATSLEDYALWLDMHEMFCVTLSTLCELKVPGIKSVVIYYFTHENNPFKRYTEEKTFPGHQLARKKRKINISTTLDALLYSAYVLVKECPSLLSLTWPWGELLVFMKDSKLDSLGLLSARNIIAIILRLPEDEPRFLKDFDFQDLSLNILLETHKTIHSKSLLLHEDDHDDETFRKNVLMNDIEEKLVSIQGIMLPKSDTGDIITKNLTITSELQENLRSVAVALSLGHTVLLQGPVGCGKTALVEYLADCTGRSSELIKVQLGEEVDSKMLIGNYQCTAVPGEFVWQPGALTQAILNGHWILMEDIDKAPLDVISLLSHLVEHGSIEIHGQPHEIVFESSRFHLFLTRRTHDNTSSSFHIPGFSKLLSHSCVVGMKSFSTSDLKQIVVDKYPNLSSVIDKIITIYTAIEKYTEGDKIDSASGCRWRSNAMCRYLGLRDLLKLCHRISMHQKSGVLDSGIGVLVSMETVDCLIASSMSDSERNNKVALVHRHLSLPSTHMFTMKSGLIYELKLKEISYAKKLAEYLLAKTVYNPEENKGDHISDEYFLHKYKPSFHIDDKIMKIGRTCLSRTKTTCHRKESRQMFAFTRHSAVLLESVASAVASCEPVLLVGETGVGKTSVIQYLAQELGRPLHVVNMSQHSSASDLLGGFKPTQIKHIIGPIRNEFERLFSLTFSNEKNKNFMKHIQSCYLNERFHELQSLMSHCSTAAMKKFRVKEPRKEEEMAQQRNQQMADSWKVLATKIESLRLQLKSQSAAAFTFVEGILSRELKNGGWILLDEINLASAETIECLSSVLESRDGSVVLVEAGDSKPVKRHPDFRLFAAMNPPSDIGKKNLPLSVRNRFLEFYVPELNDDNDICTLISYYLQQKRVVPTAVVTKALTFYKHVRKLASTSLVDGTGHKPLYSLRTLCRALRFVSDHPSWPLYQALYEGACLSFLTEIDPSAHAIVTNAIISKLIGKENFRSIAKTPVLPPSHFFKTVEGYHIRSGDLSPCEDAKYILTPYVRHNLRILSRAVSYGRYPILIQGETSSGKTSIIKYLAAETGNVVMRINNHEHTDVQEYVGSYVASDTGKLIFQDGPLVTAMRKGYWIILDELNLASSDVLEALNRVLDDNRELFIAETQETVSAHPRFTLFATQNPVGGYGGRKTLSRALRNRFIELHFGEIPINEIKSILHERSLLPMSRCFKLVNVMQDLRVFRKKSGIFSGKHGFITLRDLFKWAERARREQEHVESDMYDLDLNLARDGYLLLAGRVRNSEEESIIREIIEKHLGRKIVPDDIFSREATLRILGDKSFGAFNHIVLTKSMRRMCVTAHRAMLFEEPILLVGETGCGKTSVCQLLTDQRERDLFVINCHSHTDASDFIGGLRPIRHDESNTGDDTKLFEWMDGPLVNAMIAGSSFLVDEISLAQDSVLERLNSVLETERTLVVPEKISSDKAVGIDSMVIVANNGFQFMATMNPGGDYGKKELSPALRNRFTEIWCSLAEDKDSDFEEIIKHNLKVKLPYLDCFPKMIVQFVYWFTSRSFGTKYVKSIRDIWKWIKFLNASVDMPCDIDAGMAYVHGALLVYIDGIGSDLSGDFSSQAAEVRKTCLEYITNQLKVFDLLDFMSADGRMNLRNLFNGNDGLHSEMDLATLSSTHFGIEPFYVACGLELSQNPSDYSFHSPTTSKNLFRLLRGLQLPEPILLEGAPGIGKTSLVQSLAEASGHSFIRINLSEQTDISDLIGADMPVEDAVGGRFQWRDGPVLTGLKAGSWILFDELNLASQSVLEGLNSVFDHRSSIYIPELSLTFDVDSSGTRFFACQNPLQQGGGRKGLPKSFLNRFNQVYMESLSCVDMTFILCRRFPDIPQSLISQMVMLNQKVNDEIVHNSNWAHAGSPWDFNLRDLTRWCQLMCSTKHAGEFDPGCSFYLIYCERLQSIEDRQKMSELFCDEFPGSHLYLPSKAFFISLKLVQVGNAHMSRIGLSSLEKCQSLQLLPSMLHPMESLLNILNQGWMCILSGHSQSGKTSLVSSLAALTGHKFSIVSVNSCTDTTDLVGGFEQLDVFRSLHKVVETVSDLITAQLRKVLRTCSTNGAGFSLALKYSKAFDELHSYKSALRNSSDGRSAIKTALTLSSLVTKLLDLLINVGADERVINQIKACHKKAIELHDKLQSSTRGSHEWVDSTLVNCLRKGEWLVIDDANLCSPSVLDRLNSLLEPNGTLTVTERGVINGCIEEIKPHPSFRLILCLDSLHGNLSRAMRNRGVEVHLLSSLSELPESMNPQSHITWEEIEEIINFRLSRLYMLDSSVVSCIAKGIQRACQNSNESERTSITSAQMNAVGIAEGICEDLSFHVFSPSSVLAVCQKHLNGTPRMHEICQAIEDCLKSNPSNQFQLPQKSIMDLALNSTVSQVYHQASFLNDLQSSALLKKYSHADLFTVAIHYLIKLSSRRDFKLRIHLLSEYTARNGLSLPDIDHTETKHFLERLLQNVIFKDKSLMMLESRMDDFMHDYKEEFYSVSWDPRWYGQLLNAVGLALSEEDENILDLISVIFDVRINFFEDKQMCNALMENTGNDLQENNFKNVKNHGPLILSSLYHSGTVTLDHLQHPAVAHLHPLFEKLETFVIENLKQCQDCKFDDDAQKAVANTIFEISFLRRKLMKSGRFDVVDFFVCVCNLQSCVLNFTSMLPYTDSHTELFEIVKMHFDNIKALLGVMSDESNAKMQKQIRNSVIQKMPQANLYQSSDQVTLIRFVQYLIEAAVKSLKKYVGDDKIEFLVLLNDHVLNLCTVLVELKIYETVNSNIVLMRTCLTSVDNDQDIKVFTDIREKLSTITMSLQDVFNKFNWPIDLNPKVFDKSGISLQHQNIDLVLEDSEQGSRDDRGSARFLTISTSFTFKEISSTLRLLIGSLLNKPDLNFIVSSIKAIHDFLISHCSMNPRIIISAKSLLTLAQRSVSETAGASCIDKPSFLSHILDMINTDVQCYQDSGTGDQSQSVFLSHKPVISEASLKIIYGDALESLPIYLQHTDGRFNNHSSLWQLSSTWLYDHLSVPVKDREKKIMELQVLQEMLWINSSLYPVPQTKVGESECQKRSRLLTSPVILLLQYFMNQLLLFQNKKGNFLHVLLNDDIFVHLQKLKIKMTEFSLDLEPDQEKTATVQLLNDILAQISMVITNYDNLPSDFLISKSSWIETLQEHLRLTLLHMAKLIANSPLQQCVADRDEIFLENVGKCWIWLGSLSLVLMSPQHEVDPVHHLQSKFECQQYQVDKLECEVEIYHAYHKKMMGEVLNFEDKTMFTGMRLHPRMLLCYQNLEARKQKMMITSSKLCHRSSDQFKKLRKIAKQFTTSITSPDSLHNFFNIFNSVMNKDRDASVKQQKFLSVGNKMETAIVEFESELEDYIDFPDYVAPMMDALNAVNIGLKVTCQLIEAVNGFELEQMTMVRFFVDVMTNSEHHETPSSIIIFAKAFQEYYNGNISCSLPTNIYEKTIATLLLQYRNRVHFQGVTSLDYADIHFLVDTVFRIWQKEEDAKMMEDKTSLYKPQVHADEMSEEEADEQEFQKSFPQFYESMADIMQESPEQQQASHSYSKKSHQWEFLYKLAISLHKEMIKKSFDATIVLDGSDDPWEELPLLFGHLHFSSEFQNCYPQFISEETDALMQSSHIMVCKHLKHYLTGDGEKVPTNVYRDSWPQESSKCLLVLRELSTFITQSLLLKCPDNPTLMTILQMTEKIMAIDAGAPLIKLITAVEILISNIQSWEKNASSSLSLFAYMDKLMKLDALWRKMEIKSWDTLLNDTLRSKRTDDSMYIRVYHLILNSVEEEDILGLVEALCQFFGTSTLAEFSSRLEIINIFFKQLYLFGDKQSLLMTVLWNVCQYYSQFSSTISARVAEFCNQTEKKITDARKICEWNTMNAFAKKDVIIRAQRSIFSELKKFSKIVGQEVPDFLHLTEDNTTSSGEDLNADKMVKKYMEKSCNLKRCHLSHVTEEKLKMTVQYIRRHMDVPVNLFNEHLLSLAPLVVRLPHLTNKLFQYCLEWTVSNTHGFFEKMLILDSFVDELSLFNETKKCNTLAEAKAVRVQKRSSLNNLFKSLKSIGLSYHKGNVLVQQLNLREFFQTPFCCKSALSLNCDINDLWRNRLTLFKHADTSFYRNIIKWFSLSSSLSAPHKDINRITLDRIRGYIGEVITMSLKQRTWISAFGNAENELDQFLLSFSTFNDSDFVLPQKTCQLLVKESRNVVDDWIISLSKFTAWLECCPNSMSGSRCDRTNSFLPGVATPIPDEKLPLFAKMRYGDELWMRSMKDAKDLLSISNDLKKILDPEPNDVFISGQGRLITEDKMRKISNLVSQTYSFSVKFCDSVSHLIMNPLNHSTINISPAANVLRNKMKLERIEEAFQEVLCIGSTEQVTSKEGNPEVSKLLLAANELVSSVLINVQALKKISTYTTAELKKCESESELVEEKILLELHNTMQMHYKSLQIDLTLISFQRFFQTIREVSEVKGIKIPGLIFSTLKPAVERFYDVLTVINISLEKMHHTTCKLCARLSTIFLDVLANGFGSLEEFQEQENKSENDMKMEDIDEGGVGEGKGETNVSDEIENELFDDLQEDNTPADEEQGDQRDKDAVEMLNDFEGNFDDAEEKESEQEEDDDKSDISDQMGESQFNSGNDELDKCLWGDDSGEQEQFDEHNDEVKNSNNTDQSELAAKSESAGREEYSEEQEQEDDNEQSKDDLNVDEVRKDISCEDIDFDDKQEEEGQELDQEAHTDIDDESHKNEKEDISEELDFDSLEESTKDEEQEDEEVATGEDIGYVSDEDDHNGFSDEVESREEVDVSNDRDQDNAAMEEVNPSKHQEMENPDVACSVWGDEDYGEDSRNPNKNEMDLQQEEGDNKGPRMSSQSSTKTKEADSVSSTSAPDEAKRNDLNDALKREKIPRNVDHNIQQDTDELIVEVKPVCTDECFDLIQDVIEKHLNVVDPEHGGEQERNDTEVTDKSNQRESDMYQITKEELRYDKKTLDSSMKEEIVGNDIKSEQDIEKTLQEDYKCDMTEVSAANHKDSNTDPTQMASDSETSEEMEMNDEIDSSNTVDETSKNEKLSDDKLQLTSTIHTSISCFKQLEPSEIEKIRLSLEEKLLHWSHNFSGIEIRDAELTWQKIRNLTQPISLQLCEQLRLILEPTKAAQLKGDYRTGKRLNMRKIIPYIASGFRKDKIWLRRLKPSKRMYQIMLAVDDSSSMLDNHSKELAFESVSVISNALTTLEAGQLAICSFGETTKILHSFDDPFTDRSGAAIIAQCSFSQKKTLLAKFLQQSITVLQDAQRNSMSGGPHPDIAQLLLIISDGRGLYQEGKDVVVRAVHAAQGARIFIAFVIIDQTPDKHSSILNIKVPVFKGPNKAPEITSYLDDFPFPFYLILRNINDLPHTLGDALRQWFEMIVGSE